MGRVFAKKMIALLLVAAGFELAVTPVQKVIQLMEGMKAKGQEEVKAEADLFAEYQSWCKVTSRQKDVAITAMNDRIGKLQAKVQRADADAGKLADDVADLDGELADLKKEQQQSTEIRDSERADFEALHKDYAESLDAMDRALTTLKRVSGNIGNAFVQANVVPKLPLTAQRVVRAFLQEQTLKSTSPAGNAYESSVGSVVELIEGLQSKLSEENAQLEQEEAQSQHAYRMLQQQLTMSLETAQERRDAKAARRATRAEDSAQSNAMLVTSTATRNDDAAYRADLESLCRVKADDFESRQKLRGEELDALQQAIDIIGSGSVAGKADKHLPALVQAKKSFALLRADSNAKGAHLKRRLEALLQAAAAKHGSTVLFQAAQRVQDSPFDKVVQMIQDMILKLQEQAGEEADHKGWCDQELAANKQSREEKTATVDELTALSDKLNAELAQLGEDIAELSKAIAELDAAVEQATATRTKEKAENTEAVADAKEAQEAVRRATGVLKDFYKKASTATALAQTKHKQPAADAPASFDAPYRGMGGSSTGVLGMLETILSDFVRLETETRTSEIQAQRSFDRFSGDSAADRAGKDASLDAATKRKTGAEKELNEAQEDLGRTQEELSAAYDSYDELKQSCVDANVSYSERVQRREEEIASLKDALKILSDQ